LAGDLDVGTERDQENDPEQRPLGATQRRRTLVKVRGADDHASQCGIGIELPDH